MLSPQLLSALVACASRVPTGLCFFCFASGKAIETELAAARWRTMERTHSFDHEIEKARSPIRFLGIGNFGNGTLVIRMLRLIPLARRHGESILFRRGPLFSVESSPSLFRWNCFVGSRVSSVFSLRGSMRVAFV